MNQLLFVWSAVQAVRKACAKRANHQEQRAVETYLASSRTACELEYRERQWLRAHS